MKNLTTNQILEIETILIQRYDLKYDEFRNEVVDHIACEIEEQMQEDVAYEVALNHILKKWHFELKPIIGHKGVPTFIVKQLCKKDATRYFFLILFFLGTCYLDSKTSIGSQVSPWLSFGFILIGFLLSVVIQKRFFTQKNYEMLFYMSGLGGMMLVTVITLTLAMFNLKAGFGQIFFLSSNHIFILTLNVLIWNLFFVSKVLIHNKYHKVQSI